MPKAKQYRVIVGTSTRASLDRKSPKFEQWVDFLPGEIVSDWPAHAPVDEWVKAGHWQEVE